MAITSKDRTSLFDGQTLKLSEDTGKSLKTWLETGVDLEDRQKLWTRYLAVCNNDARQAQELMKSITGKSNFDNCSSEEIQALERDIVEREKIPA